MNGVCICRPVYFRRKVERLVDAQVEKLKGLWNKGLDSVWTGGRAAWFVEWVVYPPYNSESPALFRLFGNFVFHIKFLRYRKGISFYYRSLCAWHKIRPVLFFSFFLFIYATLYYVWVSVILFETKRFELTTVFETLPYITIHIFPFSSL